MGLKLLWRGVLACACLVSAGLQAAPLEVLTEDSPPFSMLNSDGKVTGLSTEIVEELFKRAGVDYRISLLPWKRAYVRTRNTANTALYSTTRTPERELLFKWVGPLVTSHWALFATPDSPLRITELNAAKEYPVGGYEGDALARYLWTQGFTQLKLVHSERENLKRLEDGSIKLWASGEHLAPYIAQQEGVAAPKMLFTFREVQMSLAFHKSTPDELINKLNDTLDVMRKEGVIDALRNKYQ
jgi:polar amino acid transport system substrate-binding protein